MIGHYKQAILKASTLLNKVHKDPDDLGCLFDLQSFLVQKIRQAEKKISSHKAEIKKLQKTLKKERLSKEKAKEAKDKISRIKERIEQYRYILFIWKCFGDGIANVYFDKYGLKHTLYKTEDYMPKEEAGFITGKKGFRMEWAIIKASIEHNTAAILCDITNIIRHGDVCVALHSDPFIIEVKSSKNTNRRTDRQLQNLGQLHDFYINDGSNDFRGQKNVRRRKFSIPEVNYTKHLQRCIKQSYKKGVASVSPEKGLHYISIYKKFKKDCFEGIVNKSSMVFMLNSTKMERAWLPYYPFSRVRDANTQSDHVASAQDIEQMWKERFGLELQPFERLQIYLQDFDEWEEIEENSWYYKPFPEFTVQKYSEVEEIEACESWVRMATNPKAFMFDMVCKYHQTILMKECCIYFDEMRQLIPNPTIGVIEGMPAPNHYYYFVLDNPKSNLLSFLLREPKIRLGQNPEPFKSRGGNVPIIAFRGEEEFNEFKSYAAGNKEIFDVTPYSGLIDTLRIGRYPTENDIEVLRFCSRLRNMYTQWRGAS